jgi:methionyl-tRNA formyltransferase
MSVKIIEMIKILITKKIEPKLQTGKVYKFKRIKENKSEIKNEKNINEIYNKIRMLDGDNYPKAFIKMNKFKFFLTNAILKNNSIICNAKILRSKK